ncbi:hypothetical protein L484_004248 [Morus notabilis]|uniref:Uncharacterized protein n=1 Tax=Morus notabilis TaxID=981085 RepID=W9R297_9ROSA|nr:hypothetical protein L484_004248 [Morus notabilis]
MACNTVTTTIAHHDGSKTLLQWLSFGKKDDGWGTMPPILRAGLNLPEHFGFNEISERRSFMEVDAYHPVSCNRPLGGRRLSSIGSAPLKRKKYARRLRRFEGDTE